MTDRDKRIDLILKNANDGINHCYIEHQGHRYFQDPNDLDEVAAYIKELREIRDNKRHETYDDLAL